MLDGKDQISLRQILSISFLAVLSPMIKLPTETTALSGKGTWLASLFAIVPLLLFIWMIKTLLNNRAGTRHLGEIYCNIFGTVLGKILCVCYFLWALVLMMMTVREYSDRFLSSAYRDEVLEVFILVLLAMAFIVAKGSLRTFGRVSEICMKLLAVVIVLVLLFATSNVSFSRVMAVAPQDAGAALRSVPICMSIMGITIFGAFLGPSIRKEPKSGRKMAKWLILFLLLITVMQIVVLGALGIELTTHLQFPLFILVKNIALFGVLERMESIVVALWVIADFATVGLMATSALALLKQIFNMKSSKQMISPILMIVFTMSILIATSSFALREFGQNFVRIGELILCFVVPAAAVIVGKIRKQI